MSARRIDGASAFKPVTLQSRQTTLSLAPEDVRIRKNGVEFRSSEAIAAWTEMTVTLESSGEAGKVNCTGVVVACTGNRHGGFAVSLLFTSISKQAQARLEQLAFP